MFRMQEAESHDGKLSITENKLDKFKRKKVICAMWDKLEDSKLDSDNEEAFVCFMAFEER